MVGRELTIVVVCRVCKTTTGECSLTEDFEGIAEVVTIGKD